MSNRQQSNHLASNQEEKGPYDSAQPNTTDKKPPKAIALLSGGLDSSLAVRMMLEQGVEVEAVAIKTPFCDFDCGKGCGHRVKEVAEELGIELKTVYFGEDYLRMLKRPKHGYGSGMNPCIDCRVMMYSAAKERMEKTGADFVITGEVLFQRPMSQNYHALEIIENEAGMAGKVLRPLSAKHLAPTNAEKNGLISRENLGEIRGRSRKGQIELARHFNISNPPNAAGGCLLTDPAFAKRVKDLMSHTGDDQIPTINDVELLKVGRHFRLSNSAKLIVGRNRDENEVINALASGTDVFFEAKDHPGPLGILRLGTASYDTEIALRSARIVLRYSDAPKDIESDVKVTREKNTSIVRVFPGHDVKIEAMRI